MSLGPSEAMARVAVPLPHPSVCAEERSGQRIRARDCLSVASSSETPGRTRAPAGCPVAKRRGRKQRDHTFFGDFLRKAKKRDSPAGRHPAPALCKSMQPKDWATNQPTINSIATSAYPISAEPNLTLNPPPPPAAHGSAATTASPVPPRPGWRDSSVASTQRHVCAVHALQQHTGHQLISGGHSIVALEAAVKALQQGQGVFRVAVCSRRPWPGPGWSGHPAAQTGRLWRGRSGRP